MYKKSLIITLLAIVLAAFLYFQPFLFSKAPQPRIIDRLPDADFIGSLKILDLIKETNSMLYFYKTPFRDLTSAEYLLGQGKTFGLNLQKEIFIFANENGEYGAIIQLNDSTKTKQALEKVKQNIAVIDSSKNKMHVYFIPKLNIFLHYDSKYLLVYSGKNVYKVMNRIHNAKHMGISKLWKEYFALKKFKNENLVVFSKWKELQKYGVDYAIFAHDSDSANFNLKCYFHKNNQFPFSEMKPGSSLVKGKTEKASLELHLNAEKFRSSKNDPLKKFLIAKGRKISFPMAAFIAAWEGDLSFAEGGSHEDKERYIVSEMDEDFNVTQHERFRNILVPNYSLLFNTNEKGNYFINKLLEKGIMQQEGDQYRVLFSPLLYMVKKDNYYYLYSSLKRPKVEESIKNEAYLSLKGTNYFFKLDSINSQEMMGSVQFSASKLVQLLSKKLKAK
jgi:hypothetical protein